MAQASIQPAPTTRDRAFAGIAGGFWAGVAMGALLMIVSAVQGTGLWAPLKMIAGVFVRDATAKGGGVVFFGLLIHLVVAMSFGLLFGFLSARVTGSAVLLWSLVYGFAIWLVMRFIVLPVVNPPMAHMAQTWFFIGHLLYGLVLSLTVPIRHGFEKRPPFARKVPA